MLKLDKPKLYKSLVEFEKKVTKGPTKRDTHIKTGEKTVWDELIEKYEDTMKSNIGDMIKWISMYVSKHSPELSTRGPSKNIMFSKNDEAELIKASGYDPKDVTTALKKSKFIKPNWEVANKPLNVILSMYIHYYYINKDKYGFNEKDKLKSPAYIVTLMMTIRFYSAIQKRQFKHGADDEIMSYTIDEMSKRFLLKDMSNVFELILYIAESNIENMIDTLMYPIDYNIWYFMINLFNRISAVIKSIAEKYYENHEKQVRIANDDMNKTNDEGKKYVDIPTNVSTDIAVISRKIRLKMVSDEKPDPDCLRIACKYTKYSYSKMELCLDKIRVNDDDFMLSLVVNILSYYMGSLKNSKSTIRGTKFITIMKKAFVSSNSSDKFIIDIKQDLDNLLNKYSDDFVKTNRPTQLSVIRATLYYYTILYINKYCE